MSYTLNIFLAPSLLNHNIKRKKRMVFFKSDTRHLLDEEPKLHNVLVYDIPLSISSTERISYKAMALKEHFEFKKKMFEEFSVKGDIKLLKTKIEQLFSSKFNDS